MTSPSSTPLVKVKPLVWRVVDTDSNPLPSSWAVYHGSFGDSVVAVLVASPDRFTLASGGSGDYPTLEAAQAAAQEQWEAFVRSAIEP